MYRFHVLGVPHTASNKAHCSCAYTQKVVKLCRMLKDAGHHVIHYGNELSEVACDEHVTVTTNDDLRAQYGDRWMTDLYSFDIHDPVYRKFFAQAISAIWLRKQPNDFLLCMWGAGHRPVADAHPDLIAIEPGIGYAGGFFAKWKVFESYALLHAYLGLQAVAHAGKASWYEVVIPNYFDPDEWIYRPAKENYFLFMGRISDAKGLHIAADLAQRAGTKLVVAGPGKVADVPEAVRDNYVGFADHRMRAGLMAGARALICPTQYVEPFGGVAVEAQLSGTPVITVDWGAFSETVLHGVTGYRCRTMEQFTWAARNIDSIKAEYCRAWAINNYSTARVTPMYEEFWRMVMDVHHGGGWYEPHPDRTDLDWLRKTFPGG